MAQYKIETLYVIQGGREYYVEANSPDEAKKKFEKELVKNNMAKETIYAMTEDVKEIILNDGDRIDIEELKRAEATTWEMRMKKILGQSREKLRDSMGFGVPDEPPIGKS